MAAVSGTILAIEAASALITLSINGLIAAQKYQALIVKARAEDREITDEELATLKAQSDALTKEVLASLEA